MKKELITMIKLIGFDFIEMLIDIEIDEIQYISIEILENDVVILHSFQDEIDIETYWEDFSLENQHKIINILKPLIYN